MCSGHIFRNNSFANSGDISSNTTTWPISNTQSKTVLEMGQVLVLEIISLVLQNPWRYLKT